MTLIEFKELKEGNLVTIIHNSSADKGIIFLVVRIDRNMVYIQPINPKETFTYVRGKNRRSQWMSYKSLKLFQE